MAVETSSGPGWAAAPEGSRDIIQVVKDEVWCSFSQAFIANATCRPVWLLRDAPRKFAGRASSYDGHVDRLPRIVSPDLGTFVLDTKQATFPHSVSS